VGKSTLIHVLAGFYDNFQGTLLINGVSLHTLDMTIFRQFLGTCLTDEEIFNGSLRDNITIGRKDISDDEILHLAEKLFWEKSLKDLPEGLDTWINPDGKKLPRSLVRKIILTRALACKPKLVLIEDNLHHIDEKERMSIWNVLTDVNQPFTLVALTSDDQVKDLFSKRIEL